MKLFNFIQAFEELITSREAEEVGVEVKDCRTFEEARVLTQEAGFVLTLADGSQFQVTIVQSKE